MPEEDPAPKTPASVPPDDAAALKKKNDALQKEIADLKEEAKKKSPEKEKAQLSKEIAEFQKLAAIARKDAFKAGLPDVTAKTLAGTATLDEKVQIEVQMLVYRSSRESMEYLAGVLAADTGIERLVVHNADDVAVLAVYATVSAQLGLLKKQYQALLPVPSAESEITSEIIPALAPMAISSILGSVVDIAALFRSNVDIKGHAVTLEHAALVSQLANALLQAESKISIVYPAVYVLPPDTKRLEESPILKSLDELVLLRAEAEKKLIALEAKQTDGTGSSGAESAEAGRLKALNAACDKAVAAWIAVVDQADESANGLTHLMRAETLAKHLQETGTCLLLLAVAAAGGNTRVTQSLWWSAKVAHSGGSIVHYQLFDKDGNLKHANTLSNYIGYVSFKTVEVQTGENIGQMRSINTFVPAGA